MRRRPHLHVLHVRRHGHGRLLRARKSKSVDGLWLWFVVLTSAYTSRPPVSSPPHQARCLDALACFISIIFGLSFMASMRGGKEQAEAAVAAAAVAAAAAASLAPDDPPCPTTADPTTADPSVTDTTAATATAVTTSSSSPSTASSASGTASASGEGKGAGGNQSRPGADAQQQINPVDDTPQHHQQQPTAMQTASQALHQAASAVSSLLESITQSSAADNDADVDLHLQRLRQACAFFDKDGNG